MLIQRKSMMTGKLVEMEINCTEQELLDYQNGSKVIQDALPQLTPDEREFILSGTLPDEWDEAFPDEENEELEMFFCDPDCLG